eukprot:8103932-Lingulodinium_polyedra.AAC.1
MGAYAATSGTRPNTFICGLVIDKPQMAPTTTGPTAGTLTTAGNSVESLSPAGPLFGLQSAIEWPPQDGTAQS